MPALLTSCAQSSRGRGTEGIPLSLLADPQRNIEFTDLPSLPEKDFVRITSPGGANPGFSTARYYVRVEIPPGTRRLRILIKNPFLEHVDFLAARRDRPGDLTGLPLEHAGLRGETGDIFPALVVDPAQVGIVWARVDSRSPYRLPIHIAAENDWQMEDFVAGIVPALVGGAALTLFLYHLFLWRLTGDRSSLIFLPYLLAMTLHRLTYHGPTVLLFKPAHADWLLPFSLVCTLIGTIVLLVWALTFLRPLAFGPVMTFLTRMSLIPAFALLLAAPVFPYETNRYVYLTAAPYAVYLTLLGFTAARAGFQPAMYFALSCLAFPAAILGQMAYSTGWLAGPFAMDYAVDAAFLIQVWLMALAIASGTRREIECSRENLESQVEKRTAELRCEVEARSIAQRQAEKANYARTLFLANVSHEIRTPMNVILGTNDLFSEAANLEAEQKAWLASMRKAGVGLLTILDDILLTSRLELGRERVKERPLLLREWLEAFVQPYMARLNSDAVVFRVNIDANAPNHFITDPDHLSQILENLLSNAIKFTEKGSIDLRITSSELTSERHTVCFEVEDTGPGILPEDEEHVFEAFSPASARTVARFGGTGLGLSIARSLARLMNGDITLRSRPGEGTLFRLTVPLTLQKDGAPVAKQRQLPAVLPMRVLLGEDQAENRLLFERYLRGRVREFAFAENGAQAATLFKGSPFDLVFMDIRMPVLDGYGALAAIRSWEVETGRNPVPILALTAHAIDSETRKIREAGFTEILTKPICREDLLGAVERYFFLASSQTEAVNE